MPLIVVCCSLIPLFMIYVTLHFLLPIIRGRLSIHLRIKKNKLDILKLFEMIHTNNGYN